MKKKDKYKLIGASLYKASKSNERAKIEKIWCKYTESCPLLKENLCLLNCIFGKCQYGYITRNESGSTKRGRAYHNFVKEQEEKFKTGELFRPPEGYYKKCIVLIGDYFYLPYAHMNHKDGKNKIPFLSHSAVFVSGSNFMKKDDLTPEVVCEIVKLKPQALMGGEITSYQKEELPRFLFHLKYLFPDLFNAAVKIMPGIKGRVLSIDEHKDLECTLEDIPIGQKDGYVLSKNLKVEEWDGKKIVIIGEFSDYPFFFAKFSAKDKIKMIFNPVKKKTIVFVKDNELKKKVAIQNPQLIN